MRIFAIAPAFYTSELVTSGLVTSALERLQELPLLDHWPVSWQRPCSMFGRFLLHASPDLMKEPS